MQRERRKEVGINASTDGAGYSFCCGVKVCTSTEPVLCIINIRTFAFWCPKQAGIVRVRPPLFNNVHKTIWVTKKISISTAIFHVYFSISVYCACLYTTVYVHNMIACLAISILYTVCCDVFTYCNSMYVNGVSSETCSCSLYYITLLWLPKFSILTCDTRLDALRSFLASPCPHDVLQLISLGTCNLDAWFRAPCTLIAVDSLQARYWGSICASASISINQWIAQSLGFSFDFVYLRTTSSFGRWDWFLPILQLMNFSMLSKRHRYLDDFDKLTMLLG